MFFSDYIMIVCLCFKFHEIYIYICIFTLIIPYPSTSISLFRPHISAHHSTSQGHHASCRCGGWMPVHRIGMGNGPRPTCSSCGSWSTLDSQAKRGGVMFHMFPCLSFILICFNIVCVCVFFALFESKYFLRQRNDLSDFMWDCLRERSNMWRGLWSESK